MALSLTLRAAAAAMAVAVAAAGFCDDMSEDGYWTTDITGSHCDHYYGAGSRSVYCSCDYESVYHNGRRLALSDDDGDMMREPSGDGWSGMVGEWDAEHDAELEDDADGLEIGSKKTIAAHRSQKRSRRSTRSSSYSSGYYETVLDCDKAYQEICAMGCNAEKGTCISADEVCGDSWAGALNQCPRNGAILPIGYTTWKNVMDSATIIGNRELEIIQDKIWYNNLFTSGNSLFQVTASPENSSYVTVSTETHTRTNPVTMVTTTADVSVSTIALPTALEAVRARCVDSGAYAAYTCAYRIPECKYDEPTMTECEQKCEAVSECIADFYDACETSYTAAEASGGDTNFVCNTLYEVPGSDGCSSDKWWCDSSGGEGGIRNQGWRRKCSAMCLMNQQNVPNRESGAALTAGSAVLLLLAGAAAALV